MSFAERIASAASPQLMWATILAICAGVLLALSLLALVVGWRRHFTSLLLVCVLLSLAGVVAATVVAHHFLQTYSYWVGYLPGFADESHAAPTFAHVIDQFDDDNQAATTLGWVGVVVTAALLILGALGTWRQPTPAGGSTPSAAPAK